jgi:hypothetical protein
VLLGIVQQNQRHNEWFRNLAEGANWAGRSGAGFPRRAGNIHPGRYVYKGTMTKKLLFVFAILLAVAFVAAAADVSGKWTYEQPGRGGNPATVTLTLKADGATLTGTVLGGFGGGRGRGRGGDNGGAAPTPPPAPAPVEISDGKVDGNTISFTVKRETPNGAMTTSYKGALDGDTLQLEITRPGRNGGDAQTTKFTAKRATS